MQVSADSLAKFLEDEVDEEITTVPGIGPAAAKKLKAGDDGVGTTYQLFVRASPILQCLIPNWIAIAWILMVTAAYLLLRRAASSR